MHSTRMRTVRNSSCLLGGCTWSRGVYLVWGVPAQGSVPGPAGVYLVPVGVYLVPGGCTWSWWVYLVPGGVPGPGGYLPR